MAPRITMDELARQIGLTMAPPSNVTVGNPNVPYQFTMAPPGNSVIGPPSQLAVQESATSSSKRPQPRPMQQPAPAPQQAETQRRGLLGFLSDRDARARLAIALEGMTLNPNQAYMQMLQEGVTTRQQTKAATEAKNKTAAWLRSQGRDDLAAAVEAGVMSGQDAAQIAFQPAAEPLSSIGKLEADYRAGRISKELYETEIARMAPRGTAMTVGPNGEVMFQEGVGVQAKPLTEAQSKDNVYATRAIGALAALEPVAEALTSRGETVAGMLPMGFGGGLQSEQYQVAKTAGDEFLQAILRKDTGAAITAQEQELYGETYLPRPGDNAARLAYKAEARKRAVAAIQAGMSPAQIIAAEKASGGQEPPQGGVARISSDAEYEALPSGAMFIGPDGKTRRKP